MKIVRAPIHLAGLKPKNANHRKNWNISALPTSLEQQWAGITPALSILRGHHTSVGGVIVSKDNELKASTNQYLLAATNTPMNPANSMAGGGVSSFSASAADNGYLSKSIAKGKDLGLTISTGASNNKNVKQMFSPSPRKTLSSYNKSTNRNTTAGGGNTNTGPSTPVVSFDTRQLRTQIIDSIEQQVQSTSPTTTMSNHITLAVEALEKDMQNAENEMEKREEQLASKYIELESSAVTMVSELYDYTLGVLEDERKRLEHDRFQLQVILWCSLVFVFMYLLLSFILSFFSFILHVSHF